MLYSALILGLLGSLHCLGMCGPIAFMLPVERQNHWKGSLQTVIYHGGRLFAYGLLGAVFGLLGSGIQLFGAQQKLSIAIGIIMIVLVVIPFRKLGRFKLTGPIYKGINKLKEALGASFQKKTNDTFLTIGFLNGFLPCGLVYMALLGATAMGNPSGGFLYMILFGLGTVPLMSAAIYFSNAIKSSFRNKVRRLIPIFVVIIGALFILRGMGLGIPYVSPKLNNHLADSAVECHDH